MKSIIPKKHLIFSITYFGSLMILLLNQINELPMPDLLRKVKYPYVFVVAFLVIASGRIKKGSLAPTVVFGLIFLHTCLFGYVFINYIVEGAIRDNASQMFWFLLFVGVTFAYVAQHNCYKLFILLSYYATGLQLIIGGIRYRSSFVNPIWGLYQSFTAEVRYKNSFGFVHAGYTSNAAFLVIVLSIFFFEFYRKTPEFKKAWFWASFIIIDLVAGMELVSAAERSGIICTFMMVFGYIVFVLLRVRVEQKTLLVFMGIAFIAIAVFVASGGLVAIWGDSNRDLNITVNYPLFKAYGSPWTGLGFIENAGFHADRYLFPMPTSSLDMYFVYIYFSTGLIGTVMIGLALVIMFIKLLINKRTDYNIIGIGFYLTMMFFAIWQCNLFTHRYISSYIISVIMLCSMCNDFCMGDDAAM